jgi:thiosulfate/3-mercaptopyruvate sulfurtransferase
VTSPLITVDELAAALRSSEPPTVLDVRWRLNGPPGESEYGAGHVEGAAYVDLETALAAPAGQGGRHPLPDVAVFEAAMRKAGVRADRPVVVYDDANGTSAARAWWLLRHHGHDDVRVLDGGWSAWVAAGQPVSTSTPTGDEGDFTAGPGRLRVLDADGAAVLASTGVLLDARAGERYRAEVEPIDPVAGHIPGAVSAPATENLRPTGTFRSPEELRARFVELGVGASTTTGAYCGSGVTAAHEVLALEVAGSPGAALYAGSWSEWVTDPTRPIATGSGDDES